MTDFWLGVAVGAIGSFFLMGMVVIYLTRKEDDPFGGGV